MKTFISFIQNYCNESIYITEIHSTELSVCFYSSYFKCKHKVQDCSLLILRWVECLYLIKVYCYLSDMIVATEEWHTKPQQIYNLWGTERKQGHIQINWTVIWYLGDNLWWQCRRPSKGSPKKILNFLVFSKCLPTVENIQNLEHKRWRILVSNIRSKGGVRILSSLVSLSQWQLFRDASEGSVMYLERWKFRTW